MIDGLSEEVQDLIILYAMAVRHAHEASVLKQPIATLTELYQREGHALSALHIALIQQSVDAERKTAEEIELGISECLRLDGH
jgi:hypothetical protein